MCYAILPNIGYSKEIILFCCILALLESKKEPFGAIRFNYSPEFFFNNSLIIAPFINT